MRRNEGRLLCIKQGHWNLVTAREGVQKRQHPMLGRSIYDLIYSWWGEDVFWACFIEVPLVHAYPPFTALLRDDYYVCKPFRILYLFDKTCTQQVVHLYLDNQMTVRVETPYLLFNRLYNGNHVQFMRGQR